MLIENVVKRIEYVLCDKQKPFYLHEPVFNGAEWDYVKKCIDTGWVSSAGKFVDKFERKLAEFTGVKRAIAVCNGTAALHACLVVAGIKPEDEVIVPSLTFVATANAVTYTGAIPHFADSEEVTLGIDPNKLNLYLEDIVEFRNELSYNKLSGRCIKAIVPMHTFGHPSQIDELLMVAKKFRLLVVEDAAESLGSYYKGIHTGNFGIINSLSFNGNKVITTGGGGALLTNNHELADFAKHITTTSKIPHTWNYAHDSIGFNYRMPNLNAALGVAQLEQLPSFLAKKQELKMRYLEAFKDIKGIKLVSGLQGCKSNNWLIAILLDKGLEAALNPILEATNNAGFMTRPAWNLLSELNIYKHCPKMDLSVAKSLSERLVNVPSSANLV